MVFYWVLALSPLALVAGWYAYRRAGSRHIDRLRRIDPAAANRVEEARTQSEIHGRMGMGPGGF